MNPVGTAPGPLGWIRPADRTADQHAADAAAKARYVRFTLPPAAPTPVKIILTDLWKHPSVIADVGREFTGFHQLTGSCVGVSAGNAVATLSMVQRLLTQGATKAVVPFWGYPYGMTRYAEGDRGQGEGAVDSVMGKELGRDGIFSYDEQGLPSFDFSDGWTLPSKTEYQWSDGGRIDAKWKTLGRTHPVRGVAPINSTDEMRTAIINGYPVLTGCEYFVGRGSVASGGGTPYVRGKFDGRGGHSTCRLAWWDHPNDGPLIGYSNQWDGTTYPKDPAGLARCCVWIPAGEDDKMLRSYGGGDGETMALSHLDYFPAQPDVLDWSTV